jgi:hypothetical protein
MGEYINKFLQAESENRNNLIFHFNLSNRLIIDIDNVKLIIKNYINYKNFQKFLKIIHLACLHHFGLTHHSLYHSREPSCEPHILTGNFRQEKSRKIEKNIFIEFNLI